MEQFPKHEFDQSKVLEAWKKDKTFAKSIEQNKDREPFVFYEGPPSANGMPGIHHVMARTIKDAICRYQTMAGKKVDRKAGWDTHGLPVELGVEKSLGLKKEDIGEIISVKDFNQKCREDVMKFKAVWEDLTDKMGYWVDMDHPYITYDNKYIESIWWALTSLFNKGLLYKGFTIQPYSPMAGTGLSSHELNQPGCYRDVKDTTIVAQFPLIKNDQSKTIYDTAWSDVFVLAWTTTPWTLPSNTGLCAGPNIEYVLVDTFNRYTGEKISVILAKSRLNAYFKTEGEESDMTYKTGDKLLPWRIKKTFCGSDLKGLQYEQLLPFVQPDSGSPFRIVNDGFVTTDDGTGIVHIAPSFGADDQRVGRENNLGHLTLVNLQGRFTEDVSEFAGVAVKAEYEPDRVTSDKAYQNVDVRIAIKLKEANKAFLVEKYEHSYPHCWRTDKPIIYYPMDSWFIKTTAYKDRLIELNKTINWYPPSTGEGRFGNWLENLVDWNLSRSRYWGVPLPVWSNADGSERKVIGSIEELKSEIDRAIEKGFMKGNPYAGFKPGDMSSANYEQIDIHRPFVDEVFLVSSKGEKMIRESDIIDVWFDSGAMPFAQLHYPFENKETFNTNFPADYIAEGVDQTRGWFFTLHTIATLLFDSVAYKNVISNGLLLDKNGHKMSKRLGNVLDPFELMEKYGTDTVRWYMLAVSNPWDNLKFDEKGVVEVKRKLFSTLENTYSFFALYANVDQFDFKSKQVPFANRTELDQWILSELHELIGFVIEAYGGYDLTAAVRAIQSFVVDHLSNWYVRLNRRRFWKGESTQDKLSAYQTLYECLASVCQLAAPVAPFYSDYLFSCLHSGQCDSIHLSEFPKKDNGKINAQLISEMRTAQTICSLVLSVREKEKIKVRQPLAKIMIPVADAKTEQLIRNIEPIIIQETNVKKVECISDDSDIFKRKIKANFKTLGPRVGKKMKDVAAKIMAMGQDEIVTLQSSGAYILKLEGEDITITQDDVEIYFEEQKGLSFASQGSITVTIDVEITDELLQEGIARELTKHIQNTRKDLGLEITDRIDLQVKHNAFLTKALKQFGEYIKTEVLASSLEQVESLTKPTVIKIDGTPVEFFITKS